MYSFGKKLRNLRIEKGLSQAELADKLNAEFGTSVNKGMISKWENDKEEPRMETVRNLVSFFNISLNYLMDIKYDDSNNSTVSVIDIAEDMKTLVNLLKTSDQEIRFNGTLLSEDVKDTLSVSLENLILLTEKISKN
ncbi:helix-turn-helix domain-containing protein [Paenibacillus humicus]|uniref:helix-turn-helix domain-containing protein n=1 Tax=Paenibacillus humicus TaxID=412861 RepID=UPI003D2AF38C